MKKRAFLIVIVIYFAFISLGLPDALLGSSWNLVRVDLDVELGSIGFVTMFSYALTMIATYNAPRLLKHMQTKLVTFISILLTSSALLLISQVSAFYQIILLALPLGIGAGAIDLSLNHYVAVHYKANIMSYLHSFYGLGVTIGPLIMAKTLLNNSWREGYIIVGFIMVAIAVIVLLSFSLWDVETQEQRDEHHSKIPFLEIIKTKGVKHSLAIFLLYVHIESLLGVFVASFVYITKDSSYAIAALGTMMYFLSLTIGRLLSGILSSTLKPNTLIFSGEILMLIGSLMLFIPTNNMIFVFTSIGFIGVGSGPVFPNMMHMNPHNFDKQKMSQIMSMQMVIGYLGFGLLTPMMGQIFQYTTIHLYPYVTTLLTVSLLVITIQFLRFRLHER